MHLGRAVGEQPDAGGAVVVEALGEADVLEADREAGAAADALAARRVAGAARQAERVARQRLGAPAARARRRARITSAVGSEPVDPLAGRERVARAPARSAAAARPGRCPSAAASLSICASPAKQVWTAPNPRIAPHGGLFV